MAAPAPPRDLLDEIEPLLPPFVQSRTTAWWARLRSGWSAVDTAAVALIAVHLTVVGFVVGGGGFYLDDFRAASEASATRFSLSWLVHSPQTHFAPAQRLVVWLHTAATPLDHTTATVVTVLLQLVADVAVWRLLRTLFGTHPVVLLPLGFYLATPMNLPVAMWWAQAVSLLPVHAALAVAATAHVRFVRSGRTRHLVAATVAFAVGVLFWERALLFLVVAPPLALIVAPAGRRPGDVLRGTWRAWVSYATVTVAFLVAYVTGNHQQPRGASAAQWLALLRHTVLDGLLPALVGGPWHWREILYLGIADPRAWQVVAAAVVVGVVVIAGLVRNPRRAALAWGMVAAYVVIGTAMVGAGRLADFGPVLGRDYRYLSDVSVVAALAAALALLPLADERAVRPRPARRHRVATQALVAALVVAFVAGAVLSDVPLARRWHQNPARAYVDNVVRAMRHHDGVLGLYDTDAPTDVLPPLYRPYTLASRVLAPLHADVQFGGSSFPEAMLDPSGRPVPAALRVDGHSDEGPDGRCGWALRPAADAATVPMQTPVPHLPDLTAQVELITDRTTRVDLAVVAPNGSRTPMTREVAATLTARRGLGALVARLPRASVAGLQVRLVDPKAHACVTGVYVGRPLPLASLAPTEPVR